MEKIVLFYGTKDVAILRSGFIEYEDNFAIVSGKFKGFFKPKIVANNIPRYLIQEGKALNIDNKPTDISCIEIFQSIKGEKNYNYLNVSLIEENKSLLVENEILKNENYTLRTMLFEVESEDKLRAKMLKNIKYYGQKPRQLLYSWDYSNILEKSKYSPNLASMPQIEI